MHILISNRFKKQYKKLPKKIQIKFGEQIEVLQHNPQSRSLGTHKLKGSSNHLFSMNITGDYRVVFRRIDNKTIQLHDIGTHSQLYG